MPGAPWMAFEKPFIELSVNDATAPVVGAIGGTYPALEQASPPIVATLRIALGGAEGRWPASLEFDKTYPSIDTAYQLATGFNLVKTLPPPFNVAVDLGLRRIEVDYDFDNTTVDSLAVVAQSNTPGLKLLGNLELENLTVSGIVLNPTTTRTLLLGVSADFKLGSAAVVTISFNYPDIVLQGRLTSGTPTFTDLLSTFIPALVGASLPHEPKLEQFEFMYNQANDYLSVSTELVMDDWNFTFPGFTEPLFSLDSVSFGITRDRGTNTGLFTAHTKLLPSSEAPIGVDIGGSYLANKDLQFFAKTTTTVDVGALLLEYLGPQWVPQTVTFPKLKDVGVTLVWGATGGAKSYEFTAATASAWEPIGALGSKLSLTADLTLGHKPEGNYGKLSATATLWFIHLKVEYDFDPQVSKVVITWIDVGLAATLETNANKEQIATFTLADQTIGSMVEKFVSWATGTEFGLMAPFNVLNDISLSGLKVIYNFTKAHGRRSRSTSARSTSGCSRSPGSRWPTTRTATTAASPPTRSRSPSTARSSGSRATRSSGSPTTPRPRPRLRAAATSTSTCACSRSASTSACRSSCRRPRSSR